MLFPRGVYRYIEHFRLFDLSPNLVKRETPIIVRVITQKSVVKPN